MVPGSSLDYYSYYQLSMALEHNYVPKDMDGPIVRRRIRHEEVDSENDHGHQDHGYMEVPDY
jgi:hypothetical protein